jgi:aryl-alcohol dehydrogenase-like predicted oxidoreductase
LLEQANVRLEWSQYHKRVFQLRFTQVQTQKGALSVPKIVLGSVHFGTKIDPDTSFEIMDRYFQLGGTAIDTARIYGFNKTGSMIDSETTIGRYLASRQGRNKRVLISKGGHPPVRDMHQSRLTKREMEFDLDLSLKSLGTDHIDLYFLHRDAPEQQPEEIIELLNEFVKAGKLLSIGASNWTFDRIQAANDHAAKHGLAPFVASEIQWSLARCTKESWGDDTTVCMDDNAQEYEKYRHSDVKVFAFAALSQGLIPKAIKSGLDSVKPGTRKMFADDRMPQMIEKVRGFCEQHHCTPTQVCLAYVTCSPLDAVALAGASSVAQVEDLMTAQDLQFDAGSLLQLRS